MPKLGSKYRGRTCPCKTTMAAAVVPPGDPRMGSDILNWCYSCRKFVSAGPAHFWPGKPPKQETAQEWIEARGKEYL